MLNTNLTWHVLLFCCGVLRTFTHFHNNVVRTRASLTSKLALFSSICLSPHAHTLSRRQWLKPIRRQWERTASTFALKKTRASMPVETSSNWIWLTALSGFTGSQWKKLYIFSNFTKVYVILQSGIKIPKQNVNSHFTRKFAMYYYVLVVILQTHLKDIRLWCKYTYVYIYYSEILVTILLHIHTRKIYMLDHVFLL